MQSLYERQGDERCLGKAGIDFDEVPAQIEFDEIPARIDFDEVPARIEFDGVRWNLYSCRVVLCIGSEGNMSCHDSRDYAFSRLNSDLKELRLLERSRLFLVGISSGIFRVS